MARCAKESKASTPTDCRAFLKTQGLGASSIGLIIDQIAGKSPDTYDPRAMVAEMFKAPKPHCFRSTKQFWPLRSTSALISKLVPARPSCPFIASMSSRN
jgi:hypothetical protein